MPQYNPRPNKAMSNRVLPNTPTFGIFRSNTPPAISKERSNVPLKDVICFKCHGHGHYKNECPTARAFTQREWSEIHSRTCQRAMLVQLNGMEETMLPPAPKDGPEGSYVVNRLGHMVLDSEDLNEDYDTEERE